MLETESGNDLRGSIPFLLEFLIFKGPLFYVLLDLLDPKLPLKKLYSGFRTRHFLF